MHTTIIVLLTIFLAGILLITFYILQAKKIEYFKIRVDEAEKLIIDELNIRYEMIMSMEKSIKKSIKKELNIYKTLQRVKKSMISSYDLDNEITKATNTIYTIENDYPKLNENKDFKNIIRDLRQSDTKIIAAKSFYNRNAISLNELIKKFPYNIISKIKKVDIATIYEAVEIFDE